MKTCAWVKQRKDYKDWLNSDGLEANNGFFWIKGKSQNWKIHHHEIYLSVTETASG